MSNKASLQSTQFINCIGGKHVGETTFGFRMYDEYSSTYCNTLESIPENDFDLLELARQQGDEVVKGIIDFIIENKEGIEINGTWYDWDEIKETLG